MENIEYRFDTNISNGIVYRIGSLSINFFDMSSSPGLFLMVDFILAR